MVGDILQPTHLLFVLVVALLVLGPKRLPEVGRTLGSGIRDFRQAISGESSGPSHEWTQHLHEDNDAAEHEAGTGQRHRPPEEPAAEDPELSGGFVPDPVPAPTATVAQEPAAQATVAPARVATAPAAPAVPVARRPVPKRGDGAGAVRSPRPTPANGPSGPPPATRRPIRAPRPAAPTSAGNRPSAAGSAQSPRPATVPRRPAQPVSGARPVPGGPVRSPAPSRAAAPARPATQRPAPRRPATPPAPTESSD